MATSNLANTSCVADLLKILLLDELREEGAFAAVPEGLGVVDEEGVAGEDEGMPAGGLLMWGVTILSLE